MRVDLSLECMCYSIADPLALVSPDGAQFDLFVKRIRGLMAEGKTSLNYNFKSPMKFGPKCIISLN